MLIDGVHYISNSEIQAFKRCRRRWYLSWVLGLRPKYEDYSSLMRSGTRVHKALAQWYVIDRDPSLNLIEIMDKVIAEDEATINNVFPESDVDLLEDTRAIALTKLSKITNFERAMIEGYVQWLEETGADSEIIPITAEQQIMVSHPTMPIKYVGIVDALVWNKVQQGLEFLDHKTVQSLTQPIVTLKMNEQMLHYLFLITYATTEYVIGAHYNMLRRVKRGPTSKPPYYDRLSVRHSPVEIESYKRNLYAVSYAIAKATDNLIYNGDPEIAIGYTYPSPRESCSWDCPFFSACPMFDDDSDVNRMLEYRYVKDNPLSRYENVNILGE